MTASVNQNPVSRVTMAIQHAQEVWPFRRVSALASRDLTFTIAGTNFQPASKIFEFKTN